jgi:hypothetical protein
VALIGAILYGSNPGNSALHSRLLISSAHAGVSHA